MRLFDRKPKKPDAEHEPDEQLSPPEQPPRPGPDRRRDPDERTRSTGLRSAPPEWWYDGNAPGIRRQRFYAAER